MSFRTNYSIIKGITQDRAWPIINDAIKALPGPPPKNSKWSDWAYISESRTLNVSLSVDSLSLFDDGFRLAKEIAQNLDAPHLELRIQESDHWDFTLYHYDQVLADFSTRVSYFRDDPDSPRPWKQGDLTSFAKGWGVPEEQVAPYLVDWESLTEYGVARNDDRHAAGNWAQIFDFMRAIGVESPEDNAQQFEITIPAWVGTHIRQPWWRRAIRRISVRIKGTYPDVPRHTPEERELWRRRRENIQVVRHDFDELLSGTPDSRKKPKGVIIYPPKKSPDE